MYGYVHAFAFTFTILNASISNLRKLRYSKNGARLLFFVHFPQRIFLFLEFIDLHTDASAHRTFFQNGMGCTVPQYRDLMGCWSFQ